MKPTHERERKRHYAFTWNNFTIDHNEMAQKLNELNTVRWIFQHEEGDEKHVPHYQGYVEFEHPRELNNLKNYISKGIHWEVCRKVEAVRVYSRKTETRVQGPWTKNFQLPEKAPEIVWKPWQQEIINILKSPPDSRTIHWVWESTGNVGKTFLAKYVCQWMGGLYLGGKGADIKHAIATHVSSGKSLEVCIFDFSRSLEGYVSYDALESIKNGIFFSGKYESQQIILKNNVHCIVFANFAPMLANLSLDRWHIMQLDAPA